MQKIYKCICGTEFDTSQKINSHKRHCKEYLVSIGKLEKIIEADKKAAMTVHEINKKINLVKAQNKLNKWISEQHKCEHCGKIMIEKFGSGRFCCRSCANSRQHTEATKKKIANSSTPHVKNKIHTEAIIKYYNNPKKCEICGKELTYKQRNRKTCCEICRRQLFVEAGKKSAKIQKEIKRSQNEILFCQLCEQTFNTVKHNEAMFNGWDADIIIEDIKVAILWNGPWHYKTVMKNQHSSLEQIQNRDNIKIKEIEKCGFIPYIINNENNVRTKKFVKDEFDKFINYLKLNNIM